MKTLTRQDVNKMIKHITWALKDASEESYRFAYIAMKIEDVKKMRTALKRFAEILKKQEENRAPEQQRWTHPDPNRHNPPGYNEVPF